jgi:plastocyanin
VPTPSGSHEGCHCDCAEPGKTDTAPAAATGAPVAAVEAAPVVAAAAEPTPAAAPGTLGSIVGTVTTMPPKAAANAVVYLEDAPVVPGPTLSARVDNRQMNFIPFVQVVAAGGRVTFSNADPFPHNVFSPEKGGFNLGMIQSKAASAHVFKTPGAFPLLCNLHPNMLGYIVVTPSSYFAKANAKGEFTIKDVPAGSYKITAWAPREQPETVPVTVQGAQVTANFALHK